MRTIFLRLMASVGALLLTACTGGAFNSSITGFQDITSKAVGTQATEVTAYQKEANEALHQRLAVRKVALFESAGCDNIDTTADANQCYLTDKNGNPLKGAVDTSAILELGQALVTYANSLSTLTADAGKSESAFDASLGKVVSNLGDLDGALSRVGNVPPVGLSRLSPVAKIASTASNLIFEAMRYAKLREIVVAADPLVTLATGELSDAENALHLRSDRVAHTNLNTAIDELNAAIEGGDVATIRAKQDKVFDAFASLKQQAGISDGFLKIGAAHHELAKSAQRGASSGEIFSAVLQLAEAAKAIKQASGELTADKGAK